MVAGWYGLMDTGLWLGNEFLVYFGLVYFGLVYFGLVYFGLAYFALARFALARFALKDWPKPDDFREQNYPGNIFPRQ
ncbi:hypothetical protein PROH_06105 [Prochlorothrix hollandica PCC 9006 = CALU 1027]|uniref:Uncharacterized protein n=1 Tax=Prochlorothrix hollandica PCC 9006 = CALU 1027 TaxID=317619 RepID=A0A0M2Q2J6_PROHO|nr:hypothetical protein PROH_06105 [Prochlorothrix hollandica PCC 9006 = CALU 1027]